MLPEYIPKTEDFMAPNQVLCYGGGGAFDGVAPYLFHCQMNIVGIIDADKIGYKEINGRNLSFYSMDAAVEKFGNHAMVIITIANEKIICEVKEGLMQKGFAENHIFDLNIWTYLTVPSGKSWCRYLSGEVQFMHYGLSMCCNCSIRANYFSEWFLTGRPLEKSFENFLEKREYYMAQSKQGRIPLYCKDCRFLSDRMDGENSRINYFIISDPSGCNADCIYCWEGCSEPRKSVGATVEERYQAIIAALACLQEKDLLDPHAVIQIAGGEISINPYKHQLYHAVKNALKWFPELNIHVYSNCFIYDGEISDMISHSEDSYLQCDLDAGTPQSYINVKGFHKFYTVTENLKKYAQYGNVKIKYVMLPGWNDTDADYEGIIALLKDLGLKHLILSPEFQMSRANDKKEIRRMLFSTARFMVALEKNEIEAIMPESLWKKEHVTAAKRLQQELKKAT